MFLLASSQSFPARPQRQLIPTSRNPVDMASLSRSKPNPPPVQTPALPYALAPAKTYSTEAGAIVLGRSALSHCHIVGEVARELIRRYPTALQALFPVGAPFVAACHDIGKVSPAFVEKLRRACTAPPEGVPAQSIHPELEKGWGGHAGVSQAAAKGMNAPKYLPEILGQHHGFSPQLTGKTATAESFGGEAWQAQRVALVDELKKCLGMDWPQIDTPEQARLLAGLTSVADWIGSGRHFENPQEPWEGKIEQALDESGFMAPSYQIGLCFEDVFGFAPRPAQIQLIAAASQPGVYVLEAPMGMGKTEAALYAAYRQLEQGLACGVYFALPTQLTSNKIYDRFNRFLNAVLAPDCPHRQALLLHGTAWLQDSEMGEEGRPGGAWFNQAKRGLLAPFAVGTIDQALMAAMNVKHGFVRAFGLAGKVVILDEVHSYDAYTGTLLDALVKLLRSLHCTVIILSATLNQARRRELLGAEVGTQAYPLITAQPQGSPATEHPVPVEGQSQTVRLHLEGDESVAVNEALARAEAGQQVLWIENTVGQAQQRYLDLAARAAELGVECGLLHSRFTMHDRARIEAHWVDAFGKPGWKTRGKRGRILVGTQVLEQSLDIDADFLVSRFAPTDMLLQRMGRLWRHADTPRPPHTQCEAWVLAPALDAAIAQPKAAFGASAYVYSSYVLCRSLEVWQGRAQIYLPQDIRSLIEATYAEREEAGDMARWLHELDHGTKNPERKGRLALQQLARTGLATDGKTLPESKAQTRYSESDSMEVLLLRSLRQIPDEKASRIVLLDGRELRLPHQRHALRKSEWKALTATLMQQIVQVRPSRAPAALARDTLEKYGLQHCFYLGDPNWVRDGKPVEEGLLRLALVDDTANLRGLHGAPVHDQQNLQYRDDLGYQWSTRT